MYTIRKSVLLERQFCASYRSVFSSGKRCIDDSRNVSNEEEGSLKNNASEKEEPESIDDIIVPTTCCMSGCTNCVWIEYAEKVSKLVEKSDVDMQKLIIDKVEDPNMRAFLLMELRCRKFIK